MYVTHIYTYISRCRHRYWIRPICKRIWKFGGVRPKAQVCFRSEPPPDKEKSPNSSTRDSQLYRCFLCDLAVVGTVSELGIRCSVCDIRY